MMLSGAWGRQGCQNSSGGKGSGDATPSLQPERAHGAAVARPQAQEGSRSWGRCQLLDGITSSSSTKRWRALPTHSCRRDPKPHSPHLHLDGTAADGAHRLPDEVHVHLRGVLLQLRQHLPEQARQSEPGCRKKPPEKQSGDPAEAERVVPLLPSASCKAGSTVSRANPLPVGLVPPRTHLWCPAGLVGGRA